MSEKINFQPDPGEIRRSQEHLSSLISAAKRGEAWRALGYESWDAYCLAEFGSIDAILFCGDSDV